MPQWASCAVQRLACAWPPWLSVACTKSPITRRYCSEADQAMALLKKAADMGYRSPDTYRGETALDPLRDRPDFKQFMMDLAMPGREKSVRNR